VTHLPIGQTIKLQECRKTLEHTLSALDRLGAGIAAIHVNAAIEQLTSNLEIIEKARIGSFDQSIFQPSGRTEVTH